MEPLLTLVVPTYNSASKLRRPFASLEQVLEDSRIKVLFVDDCSSDETLSLLEQFCDGKKNASFTQLEVNSGSASMPRNKGIELLDTRYVFFLDSDDVTQKGALSAMLNHAMTLNADILRAPIIIERVGVGSTLVDRIPNWDQFAPATERKRKIVRHQGMTAACMFSAELIAAHNLRFDPSSRIGEDIKFTASVLRHAKAPHYMDSAVLRYIRQDTGVKSVTQRIRSQDFVDFFNSWAEVEAFLEPTGVSFVHEHGFAAMYYALRQYVWFQDGDVTSQDLAIASRFVNKHWDDISKFKFPKRYIEILQAIRNNSTSMFREVSKLRTVVAGHDLKFIRSHHNVFTSLGTVKYDEWSGHDTHNEPHSKELLGWADLVYCEWALGNSVWYSKRLRSDQRMVVRMHRSELNVDYLQDANLDRINKLIAISPHGLSDFSDRFDLPREKFELIPNLVDFDAFDKRGHSDNEPVKLLMVGILPKSKGLLRVLEMLIELRQHGDYHLTIAGKRAEELGWVWRDPEERSYFEKCNELLESSSLEGAVKFLGWTDLHSEYANHDFLISASDFEGNQVSPQEAIAAGVIPLVLNWRGASSSYPVRFVFDSMNKISQTIRAIHTQDDYDNLFADAHEWLIGRHGSKVVGTKLTEVINGIAI